jgi:NitT/TauT family transport system ATP-binding protein
VTADHIDVGATALEIEDLRVAYTTSEGDVTVAVEGLSLEVRRHEFLAVVGPSGCGKSTMLKALAGLIPISQGSVEIHDQTAGERPAMVFQSPRLLPWRSVIENVAYGLEQRGMSKKQAREAAGAEVKRVGLAEFETAYPKQLSGGMQQRVNLARALATDPPLLLLDEPFSALDAQTREIMQRELLTIWASKRKTAIFITHQVDEAVYLADRVVVLSQRPARVATILDIPFSRPRPLSVKRSQEFHDIEDVIWKYLEAALESGEES